MTMDPRINELGMSPETAERVHLFLCNIDLSDRQMDWFFETLRHAYVAGQKSRTIKGDRVIPEVPSSERYCGPVI